MTIRKSLSPNLRIVEGLKFVPPGGAPDQARPRMQNPRLHFKNIQIDENTQPQTARSPAKATPTKSPRSARAVNPRFMRNIKSLNTHIENPPITAQEALSQFSSALTTFEREEILGFSEIYYLGVYSKKQQGFQPRFDSNDHHLKVSIGDHIAYRYEVKTKLGSGAFGQVLKCFDHKRKEIVALKVIINTEQMHQQGKIEVDILRTLQEPDNNVIVKSYDSFVFRDHICVTYEILGLNLFDYSKSLHFIPLKARQMKALTKQILRGLSFCCAHRVVHADMKPENILLLPGSTTECKIIDFGSSCFIGHQKYEYIQSRFYRAPEVVLGIQYGPPMDMWSLGCIIVELLTGRPLFPAENEQELMEMIMEVCGVPPRNVIISAKRRAYFFDNQGKPLLRSGSRYRRIPGTSSVQKATRFKNPNLISFIESCLEWDQSKRLTPDQALQHPWLTQIVVRSAAPSSARTPTKRLPSLLRH